MAAWNDTGSDRKYVPQLLKTRMCQFFDKDCCRAGDNCRFAHSPEELREQPDLTHTAMCKAVLKGGICTAAECRYAHSVSELNGEQRRFKKKTKMCVFALRQRCRQGSSCSFAHSSEELEPRRSMPLGVDGTVQLDVGPKPMSTADQGGTPAERDVPRDGVIRGTSCGTMRSTDGDTFSTACAVNWRSRGKLRAAAIVGHDSLEFPAPWNGLKGGADSSNGSTGSLDTLEAVDVSPSSTGDSKSIPSTESDSGNEALHHPQQLAAVPSALAPSQASVMEVSTPAIANMPTLIISNVPTYLTQGALLSLLEEDGWLPSSWNFLFCPWDEVKMCNLGYAVVGFLYPQDAAAFQRTLSHEGERCGGGENSMRLCAIELNGAGATRNPWALLKQPDLPAHRPEMPAVVP